MYQLSPSILAADFANLSEQLFAVEEAGADMVHIDVMDGQFVPRISYGMPVIESIRRVTKLPFDVHLMVAEPYRFIEDFKECGADLLTVHAEACTHLHSTVTKIRQCGMKVGVAINPATPVEVLRHIIGEVDMVLVMTVNPGFGGQKFIPNMLKKPGMVKQLAVDEGVACPDIQVDGGITLFNVGEILKAGANNIVAGTSVFSGDIKANIAGFKEAFENAAK